MGRGGILGGVKLEERGCVMNRGGEHRTECWPDDKEVPEEGGRTGIEEWGEAGRSREQ